MDLSADPIEFILEPNGSTCAQPLPDCSAVGLRTGKHAPNRLEQGQLSLSEAILSGEECRATDITEEHVCLAERVGFVLEGLGNSVLEQALLETDAKVAGKDPDQVASRRRGDLLEDGR
jgi:hypothetical protein